MYPTDLRYNKEHEWARQEGNRVRVGISHYAQDELGDVVFVDLPQEGSNFEVGEAFAAVESVKAVSDIFAPVSGRVVEVNEALLDNPEKINEDPYGEGWLATFEMDDPSQLEALLDADGYKKLIEE